jgi:glucose/arabinose dehydrogenase
VLSASAALLAGLAGCSGDPPTDRTRSPSSTPPPETTTVAEPAYDTGLDHDVGAWARYDPDWTAPPTNPEGEYGMEVLVENLDIPWDLSFGADGDLFVTERTGRVLCYRDGEVSKVARPRDAIDAGSVAPGDTERSWWVEGGEGGTMGVTTHPNYPAVPLVYVYYTADTDAGTVNRLAYVDVSADDPGRHTKALLSVPADDVHNGGRIAFGPANYLWVTTGDAGEEALAADPASLAGKVLRLTPEGEAAPGNNDDPALDDRVFTLGHRNPQGLGWLPDATPVIDEHGPGPDEVNVLTPGGDYGWPAVRQPEEYREASARRPVASSHVEETTWAPAGSVFYTGDAVPALRNRFLVGCLASQRLKVVTLTAPDGTLPPLGETGTRHDGDWLSTEYTATTHDALAGRLGRIRHVEQGPDGSLYAITSNRDGRASGPFPRDRDDVLVRITPPAGTTDGE